MSHRCKDGRVHVRVVHSGELEEDREDGSAMEAAKFSKLIRLCSETETTNSSRCDEQTTRNEAGKSSFKDGRQSQRRRSTGAQKAKYKMDVLNVTDC